MHLACSSSLCRPQSHPNISHATRWLETGGLDTPSLRTPRQQKTMSGEEIPISQTQRMSGSEGRWYILLLISLMYLITYLDRVNISTVAPVISKEFGFDKITMEAIFSAFVWAYAMFQVPGGWRGDRFCR